MAKLSINAGATSETVNIFLQDSSSTIGAGLSGLVFNTAGLTAYYALPKAAPVAITLATLASATAAYSSGGFFELDATHAKGLYRFDIPNAAIASGRFVTIYFYGATNLAPCLLEIDLQSNTYTINGTAQTARDLGASVIAASISTGGISAGSFAAGALDNAAIAANAIGASELATDAVTEIANGLMDLADLVGTGITLRKLLHGMAAALLGKASGQGTTTAVFRDLNDAKDAITATVDSSGNRSAVTLDLT